jgi:hypothetical protein
MRNKRLVLFLEGGGQAHPESVETDDKNNGYLDPAADDIGYTGAAKIVALRARDTVPAEEHLVGHIQEALLLLLELQPPLC